MRERLERGVLRYVLLYALKDGPKHGYEIIKHLEENTGGRYVPSPGALYPTLQLLEDEGLLKSDQQEGRRVYQLTDAGRAELEKHLALAEGFWRRFRDHAPSGPGRHELTFVEDALHDLARTVRWGVRGAVANGDHETIRRVRLALERYQNEIREMIAQGGIAQSAAEADEGAEEVGQEPGPEAPEQGSETRRF
ncbi:MAG: PadR family transcriptional regulator [Chloroflexia bacterium]